jgi:hypothetical protein
MSAGLPAFVRRGCVAGLPEIHRLPNGDERPRVAHPTQFLLHSRKKARTFSLFVVCSSHLIVVKKLFFF